MLRGIRVNTKQELADRIYKYFDEVNREPVVYHWKYKMDEINEVEASSVEYGNYLISVVLVLFIPLFLLVFCKFKQFLNRYRKNFCNIHCQF